MLREHGPAQADSSDDRFGKGPETVRVVGGVVDAAPEVTREVRVPVVREGLNARAASVAEELRQTLTPIVRECVGAGLRPATLARALKIDRTLAARVLRAIRAGDSVKLLHEIPAPGGLRIFLDAATATGIDAALAGGAAARSVRRFEQLIDEFPGGRAALDAALGGFDDRVRERNSRAASQAIHRSMTSLLGYQADVMVATVLIQPTERGDRLDMVYVLGKYGVRRLRASSPITVFGWRGDETGVPHNARRVHNIDGSEDPENGNAYLLSDFCSRPTPPVSLFRNDRLYLFTLAENVPALNTPVDMVSAHVVRNNGLRYRSEAASFHWESHTPRFPCRVLLADVFLRDDVFPGVNPVLTTRLHSIATGAARPDAPAFQLDDVDLAPAVESLGKGLSQVGTPDIASYREMLGQVYGRLGWNADRFRGFRCRIQYPIPLVSVTFWFDLPAPPAP